MARTSVDKFSLICTVVAIIFGFIALILACVGIGTPRWYVSGNTLYVTTTINFFSYCTYDSNGNLVGCTSRSGTDHPACSLFASSTVVTSQSDCNSRMMNAAGLGIVGILFLLLGILATVVMGLGLLAKSFLNFIPGILLFLASLFMLAAIAEGSRYIPHNGYSASLYHAAHLLTIFTLFLSVAAGGRISSSQP